MIHQGNRFGGCLLHIAEERRIEIERCKNKIV